MNNDENKLQAELDDRFERALREGQDWVEVRCGETHDAVKKRLHVKTDRHGSCSGVMWRETAAGYCDNVHTLDHGYRVAELDAPQIGLQPLANKLPRPYAEGTERRDVVGINLRIFVAFSRASARMRSDSHKRIGFHSRNRGAYFG